MTGQQGCIQQQSQNSSVFSSETMMRPLAGRRDVDHCCQCAQSWSAHDHAHQAPHLCHWHQLVMTTTSLMSTDAAVSPNNTCSLHSRPLTIQLHIITIVFRPSVAYDPYSLNYIIEKEYDYQSVQSKSGGFHTRSNAATSCVYVSICLVSTSWFPQVNDQRIRGFLTRCAT